MYLGSDALALATLTRKLTYLEEGDCVVVNGKGCDIYNADDKPVTAEGASRPRPPAPSSARANTATSC